MKVLGLDLGEMRMHKPRSPRRYFAELTGAQRLYPLIVLFGLNAAGTKYEWHEYDAEHAFGR